MCRTRTWSVFCAALAGLSLLFILPAPAHAQWYWGRPYYRSYYGYYSYPSYSYYWPYYYPYYNPSYPYPYYYGPSVVVSPTAPIYSSTALVPTVSSYAPSTIAPSTTTSYTPPTTTTTAISKVVPAAYDSSVVVSPGAPTTRQSFYYSSGVTTSIPASTSARLAVILPDANAVVWLEGQKTAPTGNVRYFHTPALNSGRTFNYRVRASWFDAAGREVSEERNVGVSAGNLTVVDFARPQ